MPSAPPLHPLLAPPAAPLTPLIGRAQALIALQARLERHRLVTLTGLAGVGRTRLLQALFSALEGPVAWLDLQRDPRRTAFQAALVEGPQEGTLLVDHLEMLPAEAAMDLAEVLGRRPALRCVVASRRRLGLMEETPFRLEGLGAASGQLLTAEVARRLPTVTLSDEAVHTITEALEGHPLALKLAAARLELMGVDALIASLGQPLDLLSTRSLDLPPRHQSLKAALEISVAAASTAAQHALTAWSVFEGPFSPASAAGALTALPESERPDPTEALDGALKAELIRRLPEADAAQPWFEMPRLLRALGRAHAEVAGLTRKLALAHRAAFPGRVDPLAPLADHQLVALAHEAPDRRQALDGALAAGETEAAITLAESLTPLYRVRGPFDALEAMVVRVLALPGLTERQRAQMLCRRALYGLLTGQPRLGARALDEAGPLLPSEGPWRVEWLSLSAGVSGLLDDPEAATQHLRAARKLVRAGRAAGAPSTREGALTAQLAAHLFERGQLDESRRLFEAALVILKSEGAHRLASQTLTNLGLVAQAQGDRQGARAALTEARAAHAALGQSRFEGITLGDLAGLAMEEGRPAEARPLYEAARPRLAQAGDHPLHALVTAGLAACLARLGALGEAAGHLDASLSGLDHNRVPHLHMAAQLHGAEVTLAAGLGQWAVEGAVEDPAEGDDALEEVLQESEALLKSPEVLKLSAIADEVRLAGRLLASAVASCRARDQALVIHGGRFRTPGGAWVDLGHRAPLLGLMEALVAHRLGAPGRDDAPVDALDRPTLIAAAWPGEAMVAGSGLNRLNVALSTLRKRGLKGLIETTPSGYRLSPEVPLLVVG